VSPRSLFISFRRNADLQASFLCSARRSNVARFPANRHESAHGEADMTKRTGAQALVDVLIAQGVERVFCVPGESFLAVLDALYDARDKIATIVCRHEAAAANAAEATGKLTGRPGVAFVTRGPGASHGAVGVHTAKQDSSPMILFIGQVARGDREREAFQEV